MESWGVALVVLLAVLLGAALPALVQLRATLKAMEQTLRHSAPRLDAALDATTAAVGRVDALVARLEEGGKLERLVEGLASLDRLVHQVRDGVRVASAVGAAVGPALVAAVHALREDQDREVATPTPLHSTGDEPGVASPEPRKAVSP
jgi:hypothetical protein